jgi:FdhE protein
VATRIRQGTPLLHDQPAVVDVHFAADVFSRLVNVLQEHQGEEPDPRLQVLVNAATSGALDPERLFAEAFVQHRDHLSEMAAHAAVDGDLLVTLATQAVAPLLRAYAEHLLPAVERLDDGKPDAAIWQMGYCPVCGAWPLLAELRGIELSQFLRCSACASGWRSRRILCTYCRNDDFHQLRTLQVEGDLRFRVAVCERCMGYLKIGNAFDPPPPELVAPDDLASIDLDVMAIERGYRPPDGSGFRLEIAVPESELMEELA